MKKNIIWKILLVIGICPFAAPIISGFYHVILESWTLFDWILMYSVIFWPTYIVGLVLIILSVCKLVKRKSK